MALYRKQLPSFSRNLHVAVAPHTGSVFPVNLFRALIKFSRFCSGFMGDGVGFAEREYLVWYILFTLFVPYAMLPMTLKWCIIGGTITALSHIVNTAIAKFRQTKIEEPCSDSSCVVKQMLANMLLYIAINFAGMYTKYLTDRGQRLAFIETHKAMEHKKESEKEYQKTQRLLDSSKNYIFTKNLISVHDIFIKINSFENFVVTTKLDFMKLKFYFIPQLKHVEL